MISLIFALSIVALLVVGALAFGIPGLRKRRKAKGTYDPDDGFMELMAAGVLTLLAIIGAIVIAGTFVDRVVGKTRCEKKDELTEGRYEWVDYHFFGYECLLRTPAGNLTETPVIPLENVTRP